MFSVQALETEQLCQAPLAREAGRGRLEGSQDLGGTSGGGCEDSPVGQSKKLVQTLVLDKNIRNNPGAAAVQLSPQTQVVQAPGPGMTGEELTLDKVSTVGHDSGGDDNVLRRSSRTTHRPAKYSA